jgi:hypothetical protein
MEEINMKRVIIIVFMLVAISLIPTGCKKKGVDSLLLENTKLIESLDNQFSNYRIIYEEYETSIKDVTGKINMEENLKRNFVSPNEAIKTLSKDEFEIMAENRGVYSVNVEISDVYNYLEMKYIYTKTVHVPNNNNKVGVELTETRRYVYVFEDGQWLLANIERRMYEKDVEFEDMDHVRFNNELVDYVDSFEQ